MGRAAAQSRVLAVEENERVGRRSASDDFRQHSQGDQTGKIARRPRNPSGVGHGLASRCGRLGLTSDGIVRLFRQRWLLAGGAIVSPPTWK